MKNATYNDISKAYDAVATRLGQDNLDMIDKWAIQRFGVDLAARVAVLQKAGAVNAVNKEV
jgi:hypothetical protein